MEYRTLGKTGVTVSRYCLGAMMFGTMGNTDHDDCVRIIHRALDQRRNLIKHSRALTVELEGALTGEGTADQMLQVSSSVIAPGRGTSGRNAFWRAKPQETTL